MKLENQVVSLEFSKQLKNVGYPQKEGLYCWIFENRKSLGEPHWYLTTITDLEVWQEYCVAPTVAELGERLPDEIEKDEQTFEFYEYKDSRGYLVGYQDQDIPEHFDCCVLTEPFIENTEANARAKLWLYLKKEGKQGR